MAHHPNISDQIIDCHLVAIIGQGGAGIVYRGRQVYSDRLVAVKVMRDEEHTSLVDIN